MVYTARFIWAELDFQDGVPVKSLLGLPLYMVWHGWSKVVYMTKSICAEPIFFGTHTFFIWAMPEISAG